MIDNFYELEAIDINNSKINFSMFKNHPVIIANVACDCKLATKNYTSFSTLLNKFYEKGLRILLFPCNQFLKQESGSLETIKNYAKNYNDKFIIFDKVSVFGKHKHSVFKFLTKDSWFSFVKWNFTKWLVDKNGKVIKRYGPTDIINEKDVEKCFE